MFATKTLKAAMLATTLIVAPMAAMPALAMGGVALQSFAPLVEAAKPAVVTVVVTGAQPKIDGGVQQMPEGIPDGMEEFMKRFFGDRGIPGPVPGPQSPQHEMRGLGSGFIIDASGVIVTNNHVVQDASDITVILDDGTEHKAALVGRDDRIDIAVLRIETDTPLPTVAWGDSDAVKVGDWAVAIGNPLGLDGTVTAGIVSARGRDINSGPYDDYLQVDAAINRGNSGGPLFDIDGKVIGVNTAIMSPSGGNVGLGFAIPAAQARMIVADLLDDGQVERGWIGVSIQPVSTEFADSLGLEKAAGALVAEVMPESPAKDAGLRPGDVILGFNGAKVTELRDLTRAVAAARIGDDAQVQIWRNGKETTVNISPAMLETASVDQPGATMPSNGTEMPELGLSLAKVSDSGLTVKSVAPGTPAEASGLRPGDILLSVNQTEMDSPDTLKQVLASAHNAKRNTLLVLFDRDGTRRFVTMDLANA